jgi:aminopeptidase N
MKRLLIRLATSLLPLVSPSLAGQGVFGDPSVWRWAPSRSYHVENYRLTLHFDQARSEVFGDEVVALRPFAASFRRFYLDSADLTIDSVSLIAPHGKPVALASEQQDQRLWIVLDRDYGTHDRLDVRIVYHGVPRFGLFFENPNADYPGRPREIWSQGETEFNHHWFPCWDHPNDMATSETITTVPEGQVVVSNGRLVSVRHRQGEATYDWVESVPHSSYLTSLAIGPWQKLHDSYRGKPVDYYVVRGSDPAAVRRAFGLTPDMLGFFSRLFIEYPYEKYAQVAVADFVFGGMENVTATTLRDSVLQDALAAADYPDTELVAHELAQHWFGDFVQARDWADIWLNEGFATYLPALYTQHHEGNEAYRAQMAAYQDAAKAQDRDDYLRPIVDHHYSDDGMQMFDSITHEKGAAVLDMMRYVLDGSAAAMRAGSAASPFFGALRRYLTSHARQSSDTADLLEVVRTATGQNLDGFFHEWVYSAGSPAYRVTAVYNRATATEAVTVTQTQRGEDVPAVFDMPVELAFHGARGEVVRVQVRNDQAAQTFRVRLGFEPIWVDFDPDSFIEKSIDFPQAPSALAAAALGDSSMMARVWAVGELGKARSADAGEAARALTEALARDGFYGVRVAAAASLGQLATHDARGALLAALGQADARVRVAAAAALGHLSGHAETFARLAELLRADPSYAVRAAAALSIGRLGGPRAFEVLRAQWSETAEIHLAAALENALAATGDPRAAEILLADARPGKPLQLRLSALSGLVVLRESVERRHSRELEDLVSRTLRDSYLPLQQAAKELVVSFHLVRFDKDLVAAVAQAPTLWQRRMDERLLAELRAVGR